MATIFRCDICKKDFTDRNELRSLELPHMDRHQQNFTDEEDGYKKELCVNCMRIIVNILESTKVKAG